MSQKESNIVNKHGVGEEINMGVDQKVVLIRILSVPEEMLRIAGHSNSFQHAELL